jgi:hypothetical protein
MQRSTIIADELRARVAWRTSWARFAVLYMNYVLIVRSFGVPLYTLLHIYSLFQFLSAREEKTTPGLEAPRHTPVFPSEQRSVES